MKITETACVCDGLCRLLKKKKKKKIVSCSHVRVAQARAAVARPRHICACASADLPLSSVELRRLASESAEE